MLEVRLLGQFDLKRDSAPVPLAARAAQSLLAYLLLYPNTAHRREKLAGLLWPSATEANARNNLRQALHRLRRALDRSDGSDPTYLRADDLTVTFDVSSECWLDVLVLERKSGDETVDELIRRVSVYAGELLPGFYEDWVVLERERLQTVFERRMRQLLERLAEARRWPEVLEWGERWIAFGHTPEPAYRALMLAHAGLGDLSGAANVYQRCVEALQRELAVEPSESTRALYAQLARGEFVPGSAAEARPSTGLAFQQRYRLGAELGRGGMAVVYRARDTLLDREVAVKVLSSGVLGTEGRARLLDEARAVAKFNHPNIVAVYDAGIADASIASVGEKDGTPFIVMELVEGKSLHDYGRHAPPSLTDILSITRQICAALDVAHARGIVHRDLKPENVVITPDGTAKLMDFGLARSIASRRTVEGTIIGTVFYLAPEQALGQAVDGRADLYALGVMLYELTTGCLPFTGDNPLVVITQHLHASVVPPRTHNPEIPADLDALIMRLLSKQPHERPGSAREVLDALLVKPLAAPPLPTGTVTLLFSDIQGFTSRQERDPDEAREALARHDALLHPTMAEHNGRVFKDMGDGFIAVFAEPVLALMAALTAHRRLAEENWGPGGPLRVKMALHLGPTELRGANDYLPNATLNQVAQMVRAAQGGQILLSLVMAEAVRDHLPNGVRLEDLGEQDVKGFRHTQRWFQVTVPDASGEVSPPASPSAPRHNLPIQLSSFVGREHEIAEVKRLVVSARLITLTGAGGSGKTRLALHVANQMLSAFADGVWLVDLSPLSNPGLVPQAVASVLGVRDEPGRPRVTALLDYLREKQLLLVLDNCEHVIEDSARLADALLRICPRLVILATSRTALNIAGETAWSVPSLSLPESQQRALLENPMHYDAIRLFVERATTVSPDFALTSQNSAAAIARLCYRLDGLPLAIELAAVNVKALTVEQIIVRLEPRFQLLADRSPTSPLRHQTLQAMLDWSYNLLSAKEQMLFHHLAVFAGGWTLEAVESACSGDGLALTEIAALLAHLVNESLVVAQPHVPAPRYRMLEIIRRYAREKLSESGALERAQARHLNFFVALAEEAEPKLFSAEQVTWVKRLEAEHDNLQAALDWALANDAQAGLRLAAALWRWWDITGRWSEGGEQLAQLLSVATSRLTAARAMCVLGHLASQQRDLQRASSAAADGLALSRELGDEFGMALALKVSANVAQFQGDFPQAIALYNEGLALFRKLNYPWGIAVSLLELAYLNLVRGQLEQAEPLFVEGLAVAQDSGDASNAALLMTGLGTLEEYRRDVEQAKTYFQQALRQHEELGDRRAAAIVLNRLGKVAMSQGDFGQAATHFEASLDLRRDLGERAGIASSLHNLGHIARHQGDYTRAGTLFRQALTLFRELESKAGMAWCVSGLAAVAGAIGQPESAARLLGAAQAQFDALGTRGDPADRMEHDRAVENTRAQLDEAAFAAVWAEGQAMTLNQAIEYALAEKD